MLPALGLAVDGQGGVDVAAAGPLGEFRREGHVGRGLGAVEQRDVTVIGPVVEHVEKQGAQGRHADAAAHEHDVFPLHGLVREAVAQGRAHADLVAGGQPVQPGGHFAGPHDRELEVIHAGWGRIDNEGGFADAEKRQLTDLTRLELERGHGGLVVEPDPERFDIVGLLDGLQDGSHFRQIGILRIGHLHTSRPWTGQRRFARFRGCPRKPGSS